MSAISDAIVDELQEIGDLVIAKQRRYGRNLPRHGLKGIVIRMMDKIQRLEHLVLDGVDATADESINDTLRDIAGYCIMARALWEINDLTIDGDWRGPTRHYAQLPDKAPDPTPEPEKEDDAILWTKLVSQSRPTVPNARGDASSCYPRF